MTLLQFRVLKLLKVLGSLRGTALREKSLAGGRLAAFYFQMAELEYKGFVTRTDGVDQYESFWSPFTLYTITNSGVEALESEEKTHDTWTQLQSQAGLHSQGSTSSVNEGQGQEKQDPS